MNFKHDDVLMHPSSDEYVGVNEWSLKVLVATCQCEGFEVGH